MEAEAVEFGAQARRGPMTHNRRWSLVIGDPEPGQDVLARKRLLAEVLAALLDPNLKGGLWFGAPIEHPDIELLAVFLREIHRP